MTSAFKGEVHVCCDVGEILKEVVHRIMRDNETILRDKHLQVKVGAEASGGLNGANGR
jgi:hypothetical protein